MQINVKSVKVIKTGKNDYGDWALVIVTTDEDVKYNTLAKDAETITPGSVINIKDMDKDDKGRESFKKFEVIKGGVAPDKNGNGKSDMTTEQWAEKDRIQRLSIEKQTAFKGGVELMVAGVVRPEDELGRAVLGYAKSRLMETSTSTKQQPSKATTESVEQDWDKLGNRKFKDVGEFLTKATKELNLTRDLICEKLSINDVKEITDFEKAWADLEKSLNSQTK